MESLCPLFVFKVLLERVLVVDEAAMLVGVPLSARVQFLDMPLETVAVGTAQTTKGGATFQAFHGFPERKTPPFYSDATSLLRSLQRQPLSVTLYQQHPAAPLPVVVGAASVPVADAFATLLTRAHKCAPRHPLAAVVRDEYAVLDAGKVDVQVGTVSLSARLVCFDGQALEQMRADKVRAAPVLGSLTPRRYSRPCADEKMVTPATDTCSKCMLPKRPPSTSRHSHHRESSQATILEENHNGDRYPNGGTASATQPPACTPARLARPPSQQQQRSEGLPEVCDVDHPWPAVTGDTSRIEDAPSDTASAAAAVSKKVQQPPCASTTAATNVELQRPSPARPDHADATDPARAALAALASTVCAAVPSPVSSSATRASAEESHTRSRTSSARVANLASQHGDSGRPAEGLAALAALAAQGVEREKGPGLADQGVGGERGRGLAGHGVGGERGQGLAGPRVDGGDARALAHDQALAGDVVLGEPHPSTSKDGGTGRRADNMTATTITAPGPQKPAKPGAEVGADARLHDNSRVSQPWVASGARNVREMCVWVGETHLAGQAKGRPAPATTAGHGAGTERQFKLPDFAARDGDRIAANFRRMGESSESRPRVVNLEMNLSAPLRRYGHNDCVVPPKLVPANQGWLWCPEPSPSIDRQDRQDRQPRPQPRRGWYPGAIPRGLRLRPTRSDGAEATSLRRQAP